MELTLDFSEMATQMSGQMAGEMRPRRRGAGGRAGSTDFDRIEQALSDLVRLTSSGRVHETRVRSSGVPISRTHLRFLTAVVELGPVSVTKLAARMDMSQPTASRALQQLEGDGYVERAADPADGRVAYYTVTETGREAHQKLRSVMAEQLAQALRDMPNPRRAKLADLLTELVARMSVPPPDL